MQLIITEMNIISQARDKALGNTFLTCSSHPREQQVGNRELWGCSQPAEMPAGPQCYCVTTQQSWTALPAWLWNYQGLLAPAALDDPHLVVWITQDFLFQDIFAEHNSGMGLHTPQGGHAARKAPKPQLGRNSFEMTVVTLNLTPQQYFFKL